MAVHVATAEDHLTMSVGGTALARCEPKRGQDRIEDLDDLLDRTLAGWLVSTGPHSNIFAAFRNTEAAAPLFARPSLNCRPPASWDHLSELSARSMGPPQRQ
jgi:hypothetical protein